MTITTKKFAYLAPIVLRFSLAIVVLWFGTSQILHQEMWMGLIPDWAMNLSGLSAGTIVRMNGIFELIAGSMLVLGILTQWAALLLSAHLFVITIHLGLEPDGVRDFGLSFAMLALALFGDDVWTIFPRRNTDSVPQ
ncbi:MAG: DoxX family membrane protein [bacterium]|nr:DoxX family membrane protein [bacterium]